MSKKQLRVGIIGWRGMVGSVLLERMRAEGDFAGMQPVLFSTSQAGEDVPAGVIPKESISETRLLDGSDISALSKLDVVLTCQGGDFTKQIYPALRATGWRGYWIDAASSLRMDEDAVLVLDPVNGELIRQKLRAGAKTFVGANCTVSLMLMALDGLFKEGLVEWATAMTYQAASGAGAKQVKELLEQMAVLGNAARPISKSSEISAGELSLQMAALQRAGDFPVESFGVPLAGSLIPWIDSGVEGGQTREEWKGMVEANKILGVEKPIPMDATCVRVGVLRCHSQAVLLKLAKDLPLQEIEQMLASANEWVKVIPNSQEETRRHLTPTAVTGTLDVPVGRIRKHVLGGDYLSVFTVGDQLLWGAAEPLRRVLQIIQKHE